MYIIYLLWYITISIYIQQQPVMYDEEDDMSISDSDYEVMIGHRTTRGPSNRIVNKEKMQRIPSNSERQPKRLDMIFDDDEIIGSFDETPTKEDEEDDEMGEKSSVHSKEMSSVSASMITSTTLDEVEGGRNNSRQRSRVPQLDKLMEDQDEDEDDDDDRDEEEMITMM